MSGNNKKSVKISKVSPKGIKDIFSIISRRIFSKIHKNEVEYGQTLSKKRRKNCVLKSMSSLPGPEDDGGFLSHSPYHINFKFSREEPNFRGSVTNFQKIDFEETCCEKCLQTSKKGETLSRFSISSDSACDVSSESSCDDEDCKYRKSIAKSKKRLKIKSKSAGDVSKKSSTVENFIRIHRENFKNGIDNPTNESADNLQNSLLEWTTDEPKYESLVTGFEKCQQILDDSDYDILVTKANYRVVEPSYENLKLIESFYETPHSRNMETGSGKSEEMQKSHKTYAEVIESLKLWHLSSRYPEEDCGDCACCRKKMEDEFFNAVEGYESLENDFNNDIEEFCC